MNSIVFVIMIVKAIITALIGMMGVAGGMSGYFVRECNVVERIALFIGGVLLIMPSSITDIFGVLLVVAIFAYQRYSSKISKSTQRCSID